MKSLIGISSFGLGTIIGYLLTSCLNKEQYVIIRQKENGNYYIQRNYKKINHHDKFHTLKYGKEFYMIKDEDEKEFLDKGISWIHYKNFF